MKKQNLTYNKNFLKKQIYNIFDLNVSNSSKSNNKISNYNNNINNPYSSYDNYNNNSISNSNNINNTPHSSSIFEKEINNFRIYNKNNIKKIKKKKKINKYSIPKNNIEKILKNKKISVNKKSKIKVHTGPRGGKYVVVNGRNKYV